MSEKIILTDAMSLKEISPAIARAKLEYIRITGEDAVREFLEKHRENIISKLKRQGFSDGVFKETGIRFPVSDDSIIDLPYGGIAINTGLAYPVKADLNDKENWEKGLCGLELRAIRVCKPEEEFNF